VALVGHTAQMGGAEHALIRLVEAIDRTRWHPVAVFAEEGPAVGQLREMAVEVYVLAADALVAATRREVLSWGGCFHPGRLGGLVAHVWRLGRFFRERGVELVHTNSLKAHVYAGAAARFLGIPLVWHLRDSIRESYLPAAAVAAMRSLARILPDIVVAVSRSVACDLLGAGYGEKCTVVYDGLREREFAAAPACDTFPGGDPVVGMVGRITPWKGQHVFLEAVALLLRRGFSLEVEILGAPLFGEHDYGERLRARVRELGLEERVHFRGAVRDVSTRIRSWRALVHASVSPDPCPNVVLEAMAAGVPVIASDGGGVPEILEEGRLGWLHPMGDAEALAGALEAVLKNQTEAAAMAADARSHASRFFTASRVALEVQRCWLKMASPDSWRKRRWPPLDCTQENISRGPHSLSHTAAAPVPDSLPAAAHVDSSRSR
jgi:glycosyltransferase involved in cell wall biosynthesis